MNNTKATTQKSRKKIIIISATVLFALVVAFVLYLILDGKRDPTFRDGTLSFAPADYEKNILEDPYYLRYNRNVYYTEFGYKIPLTDKNLETANVWAKFFYDYFQTVINGDYEKYPDYFTDEYKGHTELPEKFTMQRIYDIDVTLYNRDNVDYNGKSVQRSFYTVSYRIQYNNGTFRGDFVGNDVIPLLFSVINVDGQVKIYSVSKVNHAD